MESGKISQDKYIFVPSDLNKDLQEIAENPFGVRHSTQIKGVKVIFDPFLFRTTEKLNLRACLISSHLICGGAYFCGKGISISFLKKILDEETSLSDCEKTRDDCL